MLIRRKVDKEQTERGDRQSWPKYFITKQEVMLDPWENDDCAECVALLFGISSISPDGWNPVVLSGPINVCEEWTPVRVLEDPDTGYIYYRTPIDIERSQRWNKDRSFRVTAREWRTEVAP